MFAVLFNLQCTEGNKINSVYKQIHPIGKGTLTVRIRKPLTLELFLECYFVARKTPIRCKM